MEGRSTPHLLASNRETDGIMESGSHGHHPKEGRSDGHYKYQERPYHTCA